MMKEIVILGDLCWDVYLGGMKYLPEMGAEIFAEEGRMKPGGSAANTAMILSLCGAPVSFHAVVGSDRAGSRLVRELEETGLDSSKIGNMEGTQTGFTVVLSYSSAGERMLITSPGSLDRARLEDFLPGWLKPNAHLHLSSYFIQKGLAPSLQSLLNLAKLEEMTTSLDPGHDPAEEWDLPGLSACFSSLDWFLPNRKEFLSISRGGDLVREMENFGPPELGLVVKSGEDGAYLRDQVEAEVLRFPSHVAEVRDTTCAGDAFNAGFLLALSRGGSAAEAILLGNRLGAACSEVMGLPLERDFFQALISD